MLSGWREYKNTWLAGAGKTLVFANLYWQEQYRSSAVEYTTVLFFFRSIGQIIGLSQVFSISGV